jgi:hypothetical protein
MAHTPIFPVYFPVPEPPVAPALPAPPPSQRRPRLAPSLYPLIAERARQESLRDLAMEYGVSHETIRAITRRTQGAAVEALAADQGLYGA